MHPVVGISHASWVVYALPAMLPGWYMPSLLCSSGGISHLSDTPRVGISHLSDTNPAGFKPVCY